MTKKLRIAFMGTPDFVVPTLRSLMESDHDLVCVYTQPPREKGRHKKLEKTPVHLAAEEAGIEVRHPVNFKEMQDVEDFQSLDLDVAIVAAFGMLLPQEILNAPRHGCINIHPSLLPRWRGPSPVQYAIWKGDKETGVSVMSLEKGMDSGPILAQDTYPLDNEITFSELNKILWEKGTSLLNQVLNQLSKIDVLEAKEQDHDLATYCKLFTKEQGKIDWQQRAVEIHRQIRGLNPWPGTFCYTQEGKRLKILEAETVNRNLVGDAGAILESGKITCGDNTVLRLLTVQPENKKPMDIQAALNGGYLVTGEKLL